MNPTVALPGSMTWMGIRSSSGNRWYAQQNRELNEIAKWQAWNNKHNALPAYGGIPADLRILLTVFSTITTLKSCPASIHKDGGNARKDQKSFTCLTTVRAAASSALLSTAFVSQ